jgi:FkbM family methyltransferase
VGLPVADLIYDVGMHRGEDSAFYLAKGYRVVGFEADPDHCAHARERFAQEVASGKMEIVEGAIAPGEGTVTFFRSVGNSEWGTLERAWVKRNEHEAASEPTVVPIVSLADKLTQTGVPFYAKIDIEGGDRHCLDVLAGFGDRPAYLSIEADKVDWRALVHEFDTFVALGYTRFSVVQQHGIGNSTVRTTRRDGSEMIYRMEPAASGEFGAALGRWETRERALRRYHAIFVLYRLVGDGSPIRRSKVGRRIIGKASGYLPFPFPGWYDTHARHRDA